jgi:hypothetical protein
MVISGSRCLLFSLGLFLWPVLAQAQLTVVLSAEKSSFLLYEPMMLSVKVTNVSTEQLALDNMGERPWLSFLIQAADRRKVRAESALVVEPFVLDPGKSRIVAVDLTPHYAIRDSGQYTVQATVELPGRRSFMTDALTLNIGKGEVLMTKSYLNSGSQRVISLVRFIDMRDSTLYLRVEEPKENLVYSTLKLGRTVSFTNPQLRIDMFRNIHILHPVGARLYRYTHTDADGQLVAQEDREVGPEPLALRPREDGRIEFVGGKKLTPDSQRAKLSELQQGL